MREMVPSRFGKVILLLPKDGVPGVEPLEGEGARGRLFRLSVVMYVSAAKPNREHTCEELYLVVSILMPFSKRLMISGALRRCLLTCEEIIGNSTDY